MAFKLWYILGVKSKILLQDHQDLVKLNQSLSPEARLVAFYHHSRLLCLLSLAGKEKNQGQGSPSSDHPPLSQA